MEEERSVAGGRKRTVDEGNRERERGGGMENVRKCGKCKRKQKSIAGACVRACTERVWVRVENSSSRSHKK